MHPLLSIKQLSVEFRTEAGNAAALNNISFDVNRGEIVAVVGESGSGKSVTALSILRLLATPPAHYASGKILYAINDSEQVDLLQLKPADLRKFRGREISMIFQEPMTSLNPVFTCGHQVMEAIMVHDKNGREDARKKTIRLFEQVQLPDPAYILNRYPHQLSGGQKQRVMIAMAMSGHPSLLICDEPTTALDVTVQKSILELIRDLQKQTGMGVIFITHDLGVVGEIADRCIVMYKGEIMEEGPTSKIFNNPRHPYTKALLACRPAMHRKGERLPTVADFWEDSTAVVGKISPAMALDTGDSIVHNEGKTQPEVLLSVEHLSVVFAAKKMLPGKSARRVRAVDDVSFDVYKGETLGLVGESGCGKTTLSRTLLQLIQPDEGVIRYQNADLSKMDKGSLRKLRKNIQIVFQDPYSSLNPRITIGNAITEPLMVHGIGKGSTERRQRVMELLQKVDLKPSHFNRYPHEFSGGQRQRIVIARALALNPSFLVCDESVSALDVSVQAQVLNLLNQLKKELGFTIVFISHDLSVVHYLSDRIMVMNEGRIEEIGTADQVYYNPQSAYTRKLIQAIPKP